MEFRVFAENRLLLQEITLMSVSRLNQNCLFSCRKTKTIMRCLKEPRGNAKWVGNSLWVYSAAMKSPLGIHSSFKQVITSQSIIYVFKIVSFHLHNMNICEAGFLFLGG